MNATQKRQVRGVADWGIKILITVLSGIILALLVSGGTNYQETQKRAAEVPQIKKQLNSLELRHKASDSVAYIRYIFDTIAQNRNSQEHSELRRLLYEIRDKVK